MNLVNFLKNVKEGLKRKNDRNALFFFETYFDTVDLLKRMRKASDLPDGFHIKNIESREYWEKIYELLVLIALEHAHKNASETNKDIYEIADRISLAIWEELINSFLIRTELLKIVETLDKLTEQGYAKKENWRYESTKKGSSIFKI